MPIASNPMLFVDGQWTRGDERNAPIVVRNPATEAVLSSAVPNASRADTVNALTAARRAFDEGPWPRMRPRERARVLSKMVEGFQSRKQEIVDLLVHEAGSPRRFAQVLQFDIIMDHFTDMAERVVAEHDPIEGMPPVVGSSSVGQGVIVEDPAGVAALITAFNFPFHLNLMKLGPALGAGCTTILKPSPLTPLAGLIIGEVAEEAGLPPGVLNIVTGDVEVGHELTTNPMVDVVSFTGSGPVGRTIMAQAAPTLKRVVLELGGKSAAIVFADADLDRAAQSVVMNMTMHSGQACVLNTRTLVEESVHDELAERVTAALAQMPVGDTEDDSTLIGPVISAAQQAKVKGYIRSGIEQGGTLAYGGDDNIGDVGYFVKPTLFTSCTNDMKIAQEEIFGPVGTMIPFRTSEEAVRLANDTEYGLGAGVWSSDSRKAYDVAMQMRAGAVSVNGGSGGASPRGPYGGYKQSGLGREFGAFGLQEYLETKTVTWPIIS